MAKRSITEVAEALDTLDVVLVHLRASRTGSDNPAASQARSEAYQALRAARQATAKLIGVIAGIEAGS